MKIHEVDGSDYYFCSLFTDEETEYQRDELSPSAESRIEVVSV